MSVHHRAMMSLVESVEEQVTKGMDALLLARAELQTIRHLIEQKAWWHDETLRRPAMYRFGPIEGTKRNLARLIFPDLKDPRCLENANRKPGIVWAVRLAGNPPRNRFQVWFTSKSMFRDAQARKISELKKR